MEDSQEIDQSSISHREYNNNGSIRWVILLLVCISGLPFFINNDFPGILSTQLMDHFNLNSVQYQLVYSFSTIPNIVMPFLCGQFIDYIGYNISLVLFTSIVLTGQIICVYAVLQKSYFQLLLGRFIFGLASEGLTIALQVITAHIFFNKELGFSLGFKVTFGRLGTVAASYFLPFAYQYYENLHEPLLIGVYISILGLISSFTLIYILKSHKISHESIYSYSYLDDSILEDLSQNEPQLSFFELFKKNLFNTNKLFWNICLYAGFAYGFYFTFMINVQTLGLKMYNIDNKSGSHLFALPYFIGAALIPFIGIVIDKFGKRPLLLIFSVIILIINLIYMHNQEICKKTCLLYGLYPIIAVGIFFGSLAGIVWTCIAMSLKRNMLGFGLGIVVSFVNTSNYN